MTAVVQTCLACGEAGVPCACDRSQLDATTAGPVSPWCPRCLLDRDDPQCCTPQALTRPGLAHIPGGVKPCGCPTGDACSCASFAASAAAAPEVLMGSAIYGGRWSR